MHLYFFVRGEILGFTKDELPKMIRYRLSSKRKRCQLARDQRVLLDDPFGTLWKTKVFGFFHFLSMCMSALHAYNT